MQAFLALNVVFSQGHKHSHYDVVACLHREGCPAILSFPATQVVVEGGWRNRIAYPWMEALGVPVMRTWNETVPLWSYHHQYHPHNPHPDCGHPWALPHVAASLLMVAFGSPRFSTATPLCWDALVCMMMHIVHPAE